jgi:hypothetical protein
MVTCGRACTAFRGVPPHLMATGLCFSINPPNPSLGGSAGASLASRMVACPPCSAVHPRMRGVPPHAPCLPIAPVHVGPVGDDNRLLPSSLLLWRLRGPLLCTVRYELLLHAADGRAASASGFPGSADYGSCAYAALERRDGDHEGHCKERPWWEHGYGCKAMDR